MFCCAGYKKTARYYALNILEELDSKEEVCAYYYSIDALTDSTPLCSTM